MAAVVLTAYSIIIHYIITASYYGSVMYTFN